MKKFKRTTRVINGAAQHEPEGDIYTYAPRAVRLIIQQDTCTQCGKTHRIPSHSSMLHIVSADGRRRRHIHRDRWPFAIPDNLPREIVEAHASIEYCEACFLRYDPRQPELFPRAPLRNIPRQFLPEPPQAESPSPVPQFTLEDFFAKPKET